MRESRNDQVILRQLLSETKTTEVALVGVRLELEARVTGDRRFVIMKLTLQRCDTKSQM